MPNPDAARQTNRRGSTFNDSEDYEKPERAFRETLRADLNHAPAYGNLGLVLLPNGKETIYESAAEFSFAHRLNPAAIESVINIGRVHEGVGWLEGAVEKSEKAVSLDEHCT